MRNQKEHKSFIVHKDSLSVLNKLTDEQAGKLFKAIKNYQESGEIPDDLLISIIFEPFLNQFLRDKTNWSEECTKKSNSGKLGNLKKYQEDLYLKVLSKELTLEDACLIAKGRTPIAPDRTPSQNSLDSDSDSDSEKDIKKKKKKETEKEIEKELERKFLIFWEKFNHKKSRGVALSSFEKSLKCATFEQIMKGVDGLIAERSGDPKFWKHPATWLNQQCWLDEYSTAQSAKSSEIVELSAEEKKKMAFAKAKADLARKLGVNPDRLTQEQIDGIKRGLNEEKN